MNLIVKYVGKSKEPENDKSYNSDLTKFDDNKLNLKQKHSKAVHEDSTLLKAADKVSTPIINLGKSVFEKGKEMVESIKKSDDQTVNITAEDEPVEGLKSDDLQEMNFEFKECFYEELIRIAYLLEPTYQVLQQQNHQRAEIYNNEWRESFNTNNCRVLRVMYELFNETDSSKLLSRWLSVLKAYGAHRFDQEWFEFATEYDHRCFSNGVGYPMGSRVKLLQSYWYFDDGKEKKTILAQGVIDSTFKQEEVEEWE